MNASMRKKFEIDLVKLQSKLNKMVGITIEMYNMAIKIIENKDKKIAFQLIEKDTEINELNDEINNEAIILMARQAPVASDLRSIISLIKISTEVERIADYTKNIAGYILIFNSNNQKEINELNSSFIDCINLLIKMIRNIIEAYKEEDLERAKEIGILDDEIDKIYKENLDKFVIGIKNINEKNIIDDYLQAILVNKYLERAGDHITNIVEEVLYYIKGKRYRF